jgi:hypothetical protein
MKSVLRPIAIVFGLLLTSVLLANEVEIVKVELEPSAHRWTFHVTLLHQDTGWDHFADGWRIVDAKGNELGYRKLWHPHAEEQPFTRTLADVLIPEGVTVVYIEAHDKVHGWAKQKVKVDLKQDKGDRYEIRRKK